MGFIAVGPGGNTLSQILNHTTRIPVGYSLPIPPAQEGLSCHILQEGMTEVPRPAGIPSTTIPSLPFTSLLMPEKTPRLSASLKSHWAEPAPPSSSHHPKSFLHHAARFALEKKRDFRSWNRLPECFNRPGQWRQCGEEFGDRVLTGSRQIRCRCGFQEAAARVYCAAPRRSLFPWFFMGMSCLPWEEGFGGVGG